MRFLILFLLAGFISVSSYAQQTAMELDNPLPVDSKVKIGKLDNGMTYYVRANSEPENRVELTLVVKAGSILEDEDQLGFAHMCEHMAFNGTENFKKHEIIEYLESLGMKFGPEVNAYTSFDETVYGIKVPLDSIEYLDKGLLVLHDWASGVSFEDEEIDKERGVIHEEWRMGQGAQERMMRQYLPVMLHNSRYGERLPIGKMEVIDHGERDALRRFYADWYRPDLMAVIAVGDFDADEIVKKVKDLFSKIPVKENPRERVYYEVPDHDNTLVKVVTDKEAQQTLIQLIHKHPTSVTKTVADYRENIIHNLYNGMINARLQELTLSEDPPFIYGFSYYSNFIGPKDAYSSMAMTNSDKIESALKAIVTENERVKKFGFTATEFEREQKSTLRNMEKMYNERDKVKSESYVNEYKRNFLPTQESIPGMEYEYALYQKYVPTITLEEVNALASKWISDKNRVLLLMAPEKEGQTLPTEEELLAMLNSVDKSKIEAYVDKVSDKPLLADMPTPGKVAKTKKNKDLGYETWTMKNGAKVVIKQTDFKQDEILFRAYSLGGNSLYDLKDDISASIATDIIDESGIGSYDKTELDKYLSDKVVRVSPFIDELTEGFNGSAAPADFETLLQLVYLYFTNPRQDKTAFNSYISRMKGVLENRSASPESAFQDTIQVTMASHNPRRQPMTAERLDEADFKQVNRIFKQRFSDPSNFIFYFVGNIDPKEMKPLIEKYIGGLPMVERNETWKNLHINAPKGIVEKVVKKGSEPKSVVYMKYHGSFDYTWKNRTDIDVLSEILTTKLLESIREDESGVYSIGAYPQSEHFPESEFGITIYFGCAPDNVEKLSNGVYAEIEKLKKDGPSEGDLKKAQEKKLRERETGLRENRFWLGTLRNFDYHGTNPDDLGKYNDYVKSLTSDHLKKAANAYFSKENFAKIVLMPEE
ncbi:MAG: insulinase family protein [Bacteroidales bacterium]|nr:insulinase family protein [Bacteroidales bacterium]MCF8457710.1 insulinase family protein [Bacteroidales bacterium]